MRIQCGRSTEANITDKIAVCVQSAVYTRFALGETVPPPVAQRMLGATCLGQGALPCGLSSLWPKLRRIPMIYVPCVRVCVCACVTYATGYDALVCVCYVCVFVCA